MGPKLKGGIIDLLKLVISQSVKEVIEGLVSDGRFCNITMQS